MRLLFLSFAVLLSFISAGIAQNEKSNSKTNFLKSPSQNQNGSSLSQAQKFALNNSIYVLYHEIAHLLISELDIPILGREENAADNFATLILLRAETEQTNNVLIDSALGWFLSSENTDTEVYSDDELYGEHNLDIQRAFQIVCLMVGKDSDVFGEIADEVGLDIDRQIDCEDDYKQAEKSWDRVLTPYVNENPDNVKINIRYDRGYGLVSAGNLLRDNQFFESAVDNILRKYKLPSQPNMRSKECHEANAYYDNWTGEILFCYELVDDFIKMYEKDIAE